MKPFDDKFAENVREVFDTFQEPADMEAWDTLRQKLTRKQKSRIFGFRPRPLWAAAAAVLLFISSLLWFYPTGRNIYQPGISTNEPGQATEPTVEKLTGQNDIDQIIDATIPFSVAEIIGTQAAPKKGPTTEVIISKVPETETHRIAEKTDVEKVIGDGVAVATDQQSLTEELKTVQPKEEPYRPLAVKPSKGQYAPGQIIDFQDEYSHVSDAHAGSSLQITAGSMLAFTNNQVADGVGFAAGVLNEWEITNEVSISTGGILTYNQFSIDPHSDRNVNFEAMPSSPDYLVLSWEGSLNYNFNNQYQIIAIDIPVNARFRINHPSQRNQLYLSAGFSSLLYLQEQFTENSMVVTESHILDASSGELNKVLFATKITVKEKIDAFQRFDFARLLNISFGYAIKRENDAILIEPFLKYPLGGITSRDINLGMGGISLRYSFNGRGDAP